MRIGPVIFLICGLLVLAVGVYFLYLRLAAEPDDVLSAEDRETLRQSQAHREDLQRRRAESQRSAAGLREKFRQLPDDGPEGRRAKAEKILDDAEKLDTEMGEKIAQSEQRAAAIAETLAKVQADQRATWLRRGLLFTLLGLFWSIRAAASLAAKREPAAA